MSIGWMADTAEADVYFDNRLENARWRALTTEKKTAALTTGYKRIYYSSKFDIPALPSPALLAKLKDAQCEMTYYFLIHLKDEDLRSGLKIQGVIQAGIVKEAYDKDYLNKLPIPPIVEEILAEVLDLSGAFAIVDIARDDEKDVHGDDID